MIPRSRRILVATALLVAAQQSPTFATNGTWSNPNGGLWSTPGNWLSGVANGADATADFSTLNLTSDVNVSLDTTRVVGTLLFADTTPSNNWFINNNSNASAALDLVTTVGLPDISVINTNTTISAPIAGTQGFTLFGSGTLTLSGNNTYTGATSIALNSTLIASWSAGGTFAPIKGNISNSGSLILRRTLNDADFTGIITGNGTTTITGDGGFLNLGSPGDGVARLSNQGDLTLNIGLNLFKNAETLGALNGTGDVTSNTGGAAATVGLTIGNNNHNGTFSGIIDNNGSEAIGLTKNGTGTQILTGNNTYAAGTTVNAGTLQLGDGASTNGAIAGDVNISGGTFAIANPNAQTFAGNLSGLGTFLKAGAGNLSLTANVSFFQGNVNVNGGTLTITNHFTANAMNVGASGIAGQNASLFIPASAQLHPASMVVGAATASNGNVAFAGFMQLGDLEINPTGTMSVSGTIGIFGILTVNGGSLTTGANFGIFSGAATVQNAGTWTYTTDFPLDNSAPITITGQNSLFHVQGNITSNFSQTVSLSAGGSITADASINLANGTISATGANSTITAKSMSLGQPSAISLSGGALLNLSNLTSSLTLSGNVTINGGIASIPDVAFNGGNLSLLAGTLNTGDSILVTPASILLVGNNDTSGAILSAPTLVTQTISTTGTTTISSGTTLTISGGGLTTATLNGLGNISFISGHLTILAGDFTLGGSLISPFLSVPAGSSISVAGNTTLPSGSDLALLGSFSSANIVNNGTMTVAGSAALTVGNLTNNGTLVLNPTTAPSISGNITNNHIMDAGTTLSGAGSITNNDTLTVDGTLTIAKSAGLINAGTVVLPANAALRFTNVPFNNSGVVTLSNSSIVNNGTGGATLTNNPSGLIHGPGSINLSITNAGIIDSGAGTLSLSSSLANIGTLRASAGGTILTGNNFATNTGTITLAGGIFSSTRAITNTGLINGFGTLSTASLTNNGSITFTDGPSSISGNVTNSLNKTITVTNQPATFNGNVTNNGTIKAISTTITFNGAYTGNAYLSDPSTNTFNANATVTAGGFMSGTAGDSFNFAGPAFTNNGNFTNAGSLLVSTAIINNGNFTQSGPQSWSTGATFTNTSGNATFQSNAKLSNLTITAGTVDITTSKFIIEPSTSKSATLSALRANITSHSLIASGIPANFALALLDNASLNLSTFGGNPADSNSLLLSPELLGDSNIDGTVDLSDLSTVLNNFGASTPAWTSGNFDNAPTIDLTDLSDVLNNFGLTNPNASLSPSFSNAGYQFSTAPTPEPATLSCFALIFLLLLRRKPPALRGEIYIR